MARAALELVGPRVGHHPAARDDHRPGADRLDLLEDVGRDDDRLVLGHLADQPAHAVLLVRVEAVGRLVEHQHRRVVHDRLGDADAALEALGQRLDRPVDDLLELRPRDRGLDPPPAAAAQAAHLGHEPQEGRGRSCRRRAARPRAGSRRASSPRSAPRRRRGPCTEAVPAVGAMKPVSMRIVVDLPAPFGPGSPAPRRASTAKLTSSTACTGPNRLASRSRRTISALPLHLLVLRRAAGRGGVASRGAEVRGVRPGDQPFCG